MPQTHNIYDILDNILESLNDLHARVAILSALHTEVVKGEETSTPLIEKAREFLEAPSTPVGDDSVTVVLPADSPLLENAWNHYYAGHAGDLVSELPGSYFFDAQCNIDDLILQPSTGARLMVSAAPWSASVKRVITSHTSPVRDVALRGLHVETTQTPELGSMYGMQLYGDNISVDTCEIRAYEYCIKAGEQIPIRDLHITDTECVALGGESAVRIHDVTGLSMSDVGIRHEVSKHCLRIHGMSDHIWLERVTCSGSGNGVCIGPMPGVPAQIGIVVIRDLNINVGGNSPLTLGSIAQLDVVGLRVTYNHPDLRSWSPVHEYVRNPQPGWSFKDVWVNGIQIA